MTPKEYLSQARGIEKEIRQLERMRQAAWERATSCTAPLTPAPAHGQGGDNSTAYAYYDELLKQKIEELQTKQAEIESTIERVQDRRYRELLRGRYLEQHTFERVAVDMNYSYSQVVKFLHPAALDCVAELMPLNATKE